MNIIIFLLVCILILLYILLYCVKDICMTNDRKHYDRINRVIDKLDEIIDTLDNMKKDRSI